MLKIERSFDEVFWDCCNYWEIRHFNIRAKNFFQKFGLRVKKFCMFDSQMPEEVLHKILKLMPNLVELHLGCQRIDDIADTPDTNLNFAKLERLDLVDSTWTFI